MPRDIHLRLQGKAEQAFQKLMDAGLTEQDILARALWILDQAVTTRRVGMLDAHGRLIARLGLEPEEEPAAAVSDVGAAEPVDLSEAYARATGAIAVDEP